MRRISSEYVTLLVLAIPFFAIFLIRLIDFLVSHHTESRYLLAELRSAESVSEYSYWRRQLICHRLCLLPFINPNNVDGFYNALFGKHGKH